MYKYLNDRNLMNTICKNNRDACKRKYREKNYLQSIKEVFEN